MDLFFAQLINGIGAGVVYASLALALVLIFRTTGILNFAQGEMALVSTYLTWKFTDYGWPVWLSIVASVAISFVGGALIERIIIRPVERSSPLVIVIVTIGLFLALNSLAQVIFGTDNKVMPRFYEFHVWELAGIRVSSDTVVLVAVLAVECALLWLLLQRTKIGLALRAVASNAESSRLVGVSVGTMLMFGWGLSAALGALAGSLVIPTTGSQSLTAGSMQAILFYAFAAAAIGGFDSPVGAVVGGMIVGVTQALTIEYVDALDGIESVVPLALILLVLLFKPSGLFGKVQVERV
ncbi:MAG TPA: branched-chain amino acid ABC transporter permease [Acidimicrobiia bacterium]|nr:branched-chain amino acid ABC transporter permease [Acidimicrobiia bacterium]